MPIETAALVTAIAWGRAKNWRRPPLVVWSWGVGAPLGVLVWAALWHGFGAGTGIPDGLTGTKAGCCWLLWVLGLYQASHPERRRRGTIICVCVLLLLFTFRRALPHGTSLLALEFDAALLGLLPYWLAKCGSSDHAKMSWMTAPFTSVSRKSRPA